MPETTEKEERFIFAHGFSSCLLGSTLSGPVVSKTHGRGNMTVVKKQKSLLYNKTLPKLLKP
jgi:hypothetical protein